MIPVTSLSDDQILTYQVARFFEVSPGEVEQWHNCDFLDRAEFMFVQNDIDAQYTAPVGNGK